MGDKVVVFDLDDTLYKEINYLKSAYHYIALRISSKTGVSQTDIYRCMISDYYNEKNVFMNVIDTYGLTLSLSDLLNLYRNHKPHIELESEVFAILNKLKSENISMGLLTDGRSVQQRHKIEALELSQFFSEIIISEEFGSEKPDIANYKHFESIFGAARYYYVGDNIKKDFISPNQLNWTTIRLVDNGLNIHKDKAENYTSEHLPSYNIKSLSELLNIIDD